MDISMDESDSPDSSTNSEFLYGGSPSSSMTLGRTPDSMMANDGWPDSPPPSEAAIAALRRSEGIIPPHSSPSSADAPSPMAKKAGKPKPRANPKKAAASKAMKSAERVEDSDEGQDADEEDGSPKMKKKAAATATPESAVTARKRKASTSNVKAKKMGGDGAEDQDADDDSSNPKAKKTKTAAKASTPRQRKAAPTIADTKPIPRLLDECDAADKMLLSKRDAGATWAEVNKEWERLTGNHTAASTLPNRYVRLKNNFTVIKEEDKARLLEAKLEVEKAFNAGKWGMIAKGVKDAGGDDYPPEALKRHYRILLHEARLELPEGMLHENLYSDED